MEFYMAFSMQVSSSSVCGTQGEAAPSMARILQDCSTRLSYVPANDIAIAMVNKKNNFPSTPSSGIGNCYVAASGSRETNSRSV
jgi:hypothetical protein